MNISHAAALIFMLTLGPTAVQGQAAAPPTPAQSAAPTPVPASSVSALLQPSLTNVQNTLGTLKIDKWKRGDIRDEAGDNVKAILRDLQNNVPGMIAATDAAPGVVSQAIPLVKHLDALYDVLLRVEEASRVSAPGDQIPQIQKVLNEFETARIALDDRLQQNAVDQEKQLSDAKSALKAQQEAAKAIVVPSTTPTCPTPAPVKKRKRTIPARKPQAAPATATPAPATPKTP